MDWIRDYYDEREGWTWDDTHGDETLWYRPDESDELKGVVINHLHRSNIYVVNAWPKASGAPSYDKFIDVDPADDEPREVINNIDRALETLSEEGLDV